MFNEIAYSDKAVLFSQFNNGGKVLDFTKERFDRFTEQCVGVALCEKYSLSKGKSLEEFTHEADIASVLKLYDELLDYYETNYKPNIGHKAECDSEVDVEKVKDVLAKYRRANALTALPAIRKVTREYIRDISSRAVADIDKGELDSALTKARTLLEEVFCFVIEKRGETPEKTGEIKNMYKHVRQLYNMHYSGDVDKRVKELLSGLEKILSAITEMRNGLSDSHGVGERRINIKAHHARLFVNSAQTMADFILAVSEVAK